MAFYPDELSPIDRIRNLGKSAADSLSDINAIKNRRQWKSLVLGKKDMGMNSFATIAEEKEEEISSDGSQSNKGSGSALNIPSAVVPNKKIIFPKPKKYITSRLNERKGDSMRNAGDVALGSLGSTFKRDFHEFGIEAKKEHVTPKTSIPDSTKGKRSKEFFPPTLEYVQNFAFNQRSMENQWNQAVEESSCGWPKQGEKPGSKQENKSRESGKRKSKESLKAEPRRATPKEKGKGASKKQSKLGDKASVGKEERPPKLKQNAEKEKSLNMKDVVNVYKNLAYGSKEEIKSFVENLSFVKNESEESDKNLVSMMNLKVLESKIKSFTKKGHKGSQSVPTSEEKKPKSAKPMKRSRKAHIERLARHKVVKVPAVSKQGGERSTSIGERQGKGSGKEPWKYVGMESALDKAYFVYPAYPPPTVNLKKTAKARKAASKEKPAEKPAPKVKGPEIVIRQSLFSRGGVGSALNVTASNKSVHRPSATTVCTVEFRPDNGRKTEVTNHSLLVYLHGTKAINVKSPYSDKQFSRVKFFRKDERVAPLIRGFAPRSLLKTGNVSVRNISLPDKLVSVRSIDFLDFDEDIQNITDFLRSQDSPSRPPEFPDAKKRLKSPETAETPATRHQRRPHHLHHHHHHQHGTTSSFSPDSIMNEISKHVEHLQYLPDTEENRKLIGQFFDDLDQRIEATKNQRDALDKFPLPPVAGSNFFRPIPILGY